MIDPSDGGRDAIVAVGRRLAEITTGIDALERARNRGSGPLDDEGLVPIFIGGDLVATERFATWADARTALDTLETRVAALAPGARTTFARAMIRALRTAARMFAGEALDFSEKLRDLVGVPAEPIADATVDAIRGRIEALLDAARVPGDDLAARVRRWEADRYLDPSDVPVVFEELMRVAKARTDERIFPTGAYTMALNVVRGVPYAARCSFDAGEMDLNLDVAVTRSSMKHLVCHEVFPGHSTQLLATRAAVVDGTSAPDALLVTTNAVTGAVQEGIGDQGMALLDWVENEDDAVQLELRRLQTAVGTNAAFHLQVSGWTRDRSIAYMTDIGCAQESWAHGRTTQAAHPFRGPFLSSYWFGSEAIRELHESADASQRRALVRTLYRDAHSIASLRAAVA